MKLAATLLLLTGCAPTSEPAGPPPVAPVAPLTAPHAAAASDKASPPPTEPAPPAEATKPVGPASRPVEHAPYPRVFCADADPLGDRWMLRVDPTTKGDRRRAERLSEAFPDADGIRKALARSNLPAQLRELRDVTVIGPKGNHATSVRRVGIRSSPSDGRFVFVLRAKADAEFGIAVEGAPDPTPTWRKLAKDGRDASLLPSGTVNLQKWMRTDLDRGGIESDRSARYEAVGAVDLDADGLDEVVVFEHWPEGLFVWLLRYDRSGESLAGRLLCGDAS